MGAASQPHASHSAGCCGMDVLLVPKARGPRWAGDTWGGNWQVLTRSLRDKLGLRRLI